jgi:hypothetical protein
MRDRFQVSRVRPHVHWKSSLSRAVACTSVRSQIAPHVHLIFLAINPQRRSSSSGTNPSIRCDLARSSIGTPICRVPVMTCAPFKGNHPHHPINPLASDRECPVPNVKFVASTILGAFEEARSEFVGKAVVLADGKAGTVETIWLDELHGLRISIRGHAGKWPISTIKHAQGS